MLNFTFIRTKKCDISHFFELKSVVAIILPSVYKDNRTVFLAFLLRFFKDNRDNRDNFLIEKTI